MATHSSISCLKNPMDRGDWWAPVPPKELETTEHAHMHCSLRKVKESEIAQSCLTVCYPWTVAHQAPLSMGFSRQEYWSGSPFPSPGDLPDPGIKPRSPTSQADTLTSAPPGKPLNTVSQKTSYRDTELQIQALTSKISKEERKPG